MIGGPLNDDGKDTSMITLAGTLEGIGLPALVRFLSTLRSAGRLLVADDAWGGEIVFDQGEVVAASFGTERGLAALEAIALALPKAEFRFTGGAPAGDRDVDLPAAEFDAYITSLDESQSAIARLLPSLTAVPHLVDPAAAPMPEGQDWVTIDRSTLYTLLLVDGQRSVHAICEWRSGRAGPGSQSRQGRGERGIAQTLKELAWLAESGLITVEVPPDPPPPPGGGRQGPAAQPSLPMGDPAGAAGGGWGGQRDDEPAAAKPTGEPSESQFLAGQGDGASGRSAAPEAPASSRTRGPLSWLRFSAMPALAPAWPGRPLLTPAERTPQGGEPSAITGDAGVTLAGAEAEANQGDEASLRYWRRTVVLAVLALMLLALSWLQQNGWSGVGLVGYPISTGDRQVATNFQPWACCQSRVWWSGGARCGVTMLPCTRRNGRWPTELEPGTGPA